MKRSAVPNARVTPCNRCEVNAEGEYVLYWMNAQRRVRWNFALDRAVEWARELGKPLLIFEALKCDYPWACDRHHRFVLRGMESNARRLERSRATYYPYVEPHKGAGKGLLEALASRACVVVTDDFPSFFLPRMIEAAADKLSVVMEKVDANGLLPLRAAEKVFLRAVDFRRFLQRELPKHLTDIPQRNPLTGLPRGQAPVVNAAVLARWPSASPELLAGEASALAALPIDHSVRPLDAEGGSHAADRLMRRFLGDRLDRYGADRNAVENRATSELSPYLHFGHLSSHQLFLAIVEHQGWDPTRLSGRASGSREGWWGMTSEAEAFLDQLVTWRELGYNMSWRRPDHDRYESLPAWARATLEEHANDPRGDLYTLEEFERAATHDEVWNAAQRELVTDGRIHNYLRMLWGKKILEWSATPRDALAVMIELNNKYALDGRNPNSYSGIFWCLGRYDRAWGPERPIFGKIRYMSSDSTRRKIKLGPYLARYGPLSMV